MSKKGIIRIFLEAMVRIAFAKELFDSMNLMSASYLSEFAHS